VLGHRYPRLGFADSFFDLHSLGDAFVLPEEVDSLGLDVVPLHPGLQGARRHPPPREPKDSGVKTKNFSAHRHFGLPRFPVNFTKERFAFLFVLLMLFLICLCVLLENPIHILDRSFYDLVDPLRVLLVTVLLKLLPD